jgi:hypothetical protein
MIGLTESDLDVAFMKLAFHVELPPADSRRRRDMNHHTASIRGQVSQKTHSVVNRPDRRQLLKFAASASVMPVIAGCSSLTRGDPPPASVANQVTVLGIPNGRFWPDTQVEAMAREAIEAVRRERAAVGTTGPLPPAYFLAGIRRRRQRRLRCGSVVRLV